MRWDIILVNRSAEGNNENGVGPDVKVSGIS